MAYCSAIVRGSRSSASGRQGNRVLIRNWTIAPTLNRAMLLLSGIPSSGSKRHTLPWLPPSAAVLLLEKPSKRFLTNAFYHWKLGWLALVYPLETAPRPGFPGFHCPRLDEASSRCAVWYSHADDSPSPKTFNPVLSRTRCKGPAAFRKPPGAWRACRIVRHRHSHLKQGPEKPLVALRVK